MVKTSDFHEENIFRPPFTCTTKVMFEAARYKNGIRLLRNFRLLFATFSTL